MDFGRNIRKPRSLVQILASLLLTEAAIRASRKVVPIRFHACSLFGVELRQRGYPHFRNFEQHLVTLRRKASREVAPKNLKVVMTER